MDFGESKKKLPIIMGVSALAVVAVIGGVALFAKKPGKSAAEAANAPAAEVVSVPSKEASKAPAKKTNNSSVINLNDYINITFEGYNTLGCADVEFDYEKLDADYGKQLNSALKDRNAKYEGGLIKNDAELQRAMEELSYWDDERAAEAMLDIFVHGELEQEIFLSNGDELLYEWDVDAKTALKVFGYELQYEDINVTVSGLKEAEVFNSLEGLEVAFEGANGEGHAFIKTPCTSPYAKDLLYSFDKDGGLKNGDDVTLCISGPNGETELDYFYEKLGAVPETRWIIYTVSGLGSSEYDSVPTAGMIFPYSSFEIIDPYAIRELSDEDLRYAINEIYARNGYVFNDEEMAKYYRALYWYKPRTESSDFTMDMFNDIERENLEKLQKERDKRKS